MRRNKPSVMPLARALAMTLVMGLAGCFPYVGVDEGPEWDGQVYVGGGYAHDYHDNAFRWDGGHRPVSAGSDRGRASMGAARAGGGGHGFSGGGHR
jgi:hypothetical protein